MATKNGKASAKKPAARTIKFVFDTETKGAWRMKEEGATDNADDQMIGTLYLRKAQVPTKPESAEVTIVLK